MAHRFRQQIRYINWNAERCVNQKQDIFELTMLEFDPSKRINSEHYTIRSLYKDGSWLKIKKGYCYHIYAYENGSYCHYWTNYMDDSKNYGQHKENTGKQAISKVKSMFEENNKVTLKKAFGYCPLDIKLVNSPKQFYYTNDKMMNPNRDILSVSMVDFTSHYPSCTQGKLPDWHTAVSFKGTVAPTEEYPFAFYIKSGHVAEYKVFDSHEWVSNRLYDRLFVFQDEYKGKKLVHKQQHPMLPLDEDETILCKASEYELGSIYAELFAKRKDNEEFKNAMNKSIGYMATSTYKTFRLAHVRAIILGRANAKMLKVVDKIGVRNIIQVCVDGAAYIGQREIGDDAKYLGNLHQEFRGAIGRFRSLNCYIIKQGDEIIKFKHGCYNACTDGSDIDDPKSLDDINKWFKESKIYEEDEDAKI